MARPVEHGLDYFPLDVDFFDDPKIIMIEEQFKAKGLIITTRILSMVYRNGYYLQWSQDMPLIVAKRVGCDISSALVIEVVASLVKVAFFDKGRFLELQILTSNGIQKRWQKIVNDCKRKAFILPIHIINSEIKSINTEETHLRSEETIPIKEETTQSKVKNIKVKEIKENKNSENHLFSSSHFFQLENFCVEMEKDEKYAPFDFGYYHEAMKNWSANDNMKKDWIATAKTWMLNDLKNNKPKFKKEFQPITINNGKVNKTNRGSDAAVEKLTNGQRF